MIESGVEEFPCVDAKDLEIAMKELDGTSTVLCFHAELETPETSVAALSAGDPTLYTTFLNSRPPALEVDAISLINSLHSRHPTLRLHIVHLSASPALTLVRQSKAASLPLTTETCFHYLTLVADSIPHGKPEFKCCPPIRSDENRQELWDALLDGTIDFVVSDHSPCVAELKKCDSGDIMGAWGGISTLGLGLSLLWSAAKVNKFGIKDIVNWCCVKTAKHAGLDERKGSIQVGYDADLVVWDPEVQFTVTKESLNFKNKLTPYEGLTLSGRVQKTFVRGTLVYDATEGFSADASGQLL